MKTFLHSNIINLFQAIVVNIRTSASTTRTAAATGSASTSRPRRRRESSASASTDSSGPDVQKVKIGFFVIAFLLGFEPTTSRL